MQRTTAIFLVIILIVGVSSVAVADSPYSPTRHSEKIPFAPDRPANLNRTTATAYAINYEQTLLYNDLLGSRGFTIDDGDEVRADCTVTSINQTVTGGFRTQLQCWGEIEDAFRLIQPTSHSYRVTYLVTENELKELSVHDYPFLPRHKLRQRPPSAE